VNTWSILLFIACNAGVKYGFFFILTCLVVTRWPPILNLRYFPFFGLIVPPYSWILAYTRFVQTVPLIQLTFSVIDLLNVQLLKGALFVASLLTNITDCQRDFLTDQDKSHGNVGTVIDTLIIFVSDLYLVKINDNTVSVFYFLNDVRLCVLVDYFIAYL